MNLRTTAQIEERFRRVFERETTPEERRAFFIEDDGATKSLRPPPYPPRSSLRNF